MQYESITITPQCHMCLAQHSFLRIDIHMDNWRVVQKGVRFAGLPGHQAIRPAYQ